ncbi:GDSL-like Lipase/Acylhydrolase family protein [Nitrosospira sp. Nl5]|nr:GDSL-like Lipase/Acylhydrolase family protein [Nitrosospira sp. Nl5]
MAGTTAAKNDELEMDTSRRRCLQTLAASTAAIALGALGSTTRNGGFTVLTFGDSILDCARYNAYGVHPGQLIVRNNDQLFPDYKGRDLSSFVPAQLNHRAQDGGRVDDLSRQAIAIKVSGPAVALVTVGGNDLLAGLAADTGGGIVRFRQRLDAFLHALPVRPVLLGTVYDPTFGDDSRNFLSTDARVARGNLNRINGVITELAPRYGQIVDLHRHFLNGNPSWFTHTIEPSLRGASEVRAAFLPAVLKAANNAIVRRQAIS